MRETGTGPYAAAIPLRAPSGGPWLARAPVGLSVSGPAGAAPIRP